MQISKTNVHYQKREIDYYKRIYEGPIEEEQADGVGLKNSETLNQHGHYGEKLSIKNNIQLRPFA